MTLRISLLGPVEIRRDDELLALPGYRPLALLAYLLVKGKSQSRGHLVSLLFDRPDDPRAALRWTLLQVRKTIGKQTIVADRQEIAFNFQSDHWLDVSAFEAGDLDLYRGELLEGLNLRDARQYDAWLLVERERLRAQYQLALEQRFQSLQETEDAEGVENTARQLLQLDNLREDWHQALISAYASQGKFEAARAQYELCCQILREELDRDPAPETVYLAEAIERQQAELYRIVAASSPLTLLPKPGGTTVTVMGRFTHEYVALLEKSLAPFNERSGINIEFGIYPRDFEQVLPSVMASGLTPDIVNFAHPGLVAKFVRQGQVVDVRTFLDDVYLRQKYSDALLDTVNIEGHMAGVWHASYVKSLVWYPKQVFDDAGYKVPQTWDELLALSDQIVSDGGAPWCIGIESGGATGWVGTDWVEDILLRTAPLEVYDAWVTGELPFDCPEIRRAFRIMEEIWLKEAYVLGGPAAILAEGVFESPRHMFEDPPGSFLHRQGSFIVISFPDEAVLGKDYDCFSLPPIDAEYGRPILGSGDMMVMFNDRPEVREVMRHFTMAESVRYLVEEGRVISPHRDAPFEWYANPTRLKIARILFEADAYRFDASDSMPPSVGSGTFWQGIVAWVEGADLDSVLREIDESWPRGE